MVFGQPVLCSSTGVTASQSRPICGIACCTSPTSAVVKLSRRPLSLIVCFSRTPEAITQSPPIRQCVGALGMSTRKRLATGTYVGILCRGIGIMLSVPSDSKIPSKEFLLPLMSKVLGYQIIAASTIGKLPQILKILKHGSVRGLSVASFELEVVGYTIALAYCIHKGLPFSAYGELAFLLIQAIILVGIIYYYSPPMGTKTWMKALLYCGLAPTVLGGKIDPALFEVLYASQHAIFFFARLPQIWKNFTNKGTGELSFLTCFMNFAGSIVRVFTSIQEKTPLSVILGSAIGIVMNGTLLGQIVMYQKPAPKKEKKRD